MEARVCGAADYLLVVAADDRFGPQGGSLTSNPMISIVDDDASVREATKALVRSLGYAAATFASGEAFLESDRLDDTSCLITDLQMPGMTGIELQRRLIAEGRHMPIIFVTASPEAQARSQALAAGATAFLRKPFGDETLIACLDEALAAQRV
jgi:FixJ family two-component response regulator